MNQRRYQQTLNRNQVLLLPDRVENYVGENNQVRAIDAYVNTLDLASMGFRHTETGTVAGQPPYNPWDMLKLFLYGYLNRIRSSRKLETETFRNLEVIWLIRGVHPSYKSIADFRKNHVKQLREVSRDFVMLCKDLNLFGGDEVAVDGSFLKADASIGSIRTASYMEKEIEIIEKKIEEYQRELEERDAADEKAKTGDTTNDDALPGKIEEIEKMKRLREKKRELEEKKQLGECDAVNEKAKRRDTGKDEVLIEKIEHMKQRQKETEELKERMEESGDTQVSSVDPDARLLVKRGKKVAGYNAQIAVDSKHNLVVNDDVTQESDHQQLSGMLLEAKERLGTEQLTGLADAGYYESEQIKQCEDEDITVYVPIPDKNAAARKKGHYTLDEFTYDPEEDCYRCPQGKQLTPLKKATLQNGKKYVTYTSSSPDCRGCPVRDLCIGKKASVRRIQRWEHQEVLERHRERMETGGEKVKKRGTIVEHPFGTLKSRCGIHQFLMRGLEKCRGEFSLMTLAYNLTRAFKIVGVEKLMEYCALRRVYVPQTA